MAPGALTEETPNGAPAEQKIKVIPLTNGSMNGHTGEKATAATAEESANGKPPNGEVKAEESDNEKLPNGETKVEEKANGEIKEPAKEGEPEAKEEDQTMKCHIKHLDRRYDEKDEVYFTERKAEAEVPEQRDWWQLYALCLVRHYDMSKELEYTRLYVNPQPLRQLLKDVIGYYPDDPIDVDDVQIQSPYHSLFHFRRQLESTGLERFKGEEHAESLEQFNLLLNWIKSHFEPEIAAHEKCISGELRAIAYDRLWTLFPPGEIVHSKSLEQHRAFRVIRTWYEYGDVPGLSISVEFIDFDGERLGTRRTELFVPKYPGTRELKDMNTVPLALVEEAEEIRAELTARGRRFEQYCGGQHFVAYDGIGLKRAQCGYARFNVTGRVMIDCKTYHRLDANDSFTCKEISSDESVKRERARKRGAGVAQFESNKAKKFDPLSDENVLLTNAMVRGYSFAVKRFLELFVHEVKEIEWNTRCFDDLVLDAGIKKTVQALVSTHAQKRESFDDIVKGKGQGLVCVLHGPPGVGKTLTAECVAEYVKRPLYMVSSGDLGISSTDLDTQLTRIMDMTATWRAVLLIDEADVFLERRSLHDLHRNAMVSVFLRVLEYYSGILFLTTNRVATFDDAFKSRIHIPIRYTDLSTESRMQIWRSFCSRVPGGVDIDDFGFRLLAEHDLNGRQIKNVIKAAESLAAFDGAKLDLHQLQQVTKIQATFEKDLTSLSGIDYTAPGNSKKDADSRNMFL